MRNLRWKAAAWIGIGLSLFMSACGGGGGGTTPPPTTYVLTVNSTNPASGVAITVSPADNNGAANGTTSFTRTYNAGTSVTLTAPATSGSDTFVSWSGCASASTVTCTVAMSANTTVTANYAVAAKITLTVTVTPSASSITTVQALPVTVAVSAPSGDATPTGSVTLTSGSYTSAAATLSSGGATINVLAGSLAVGTDTLTANYTPDSGSSATYNSASGTGSVTVTAGSVTAVTVNIDVLANRHSISQFVYGGNTWAPSASTIADSGTTLLRWGGNDASNYNWQLQTRNSAADWYFEDYGGAGDSVGMITDVQNAGSHALTTMAMMDWVAQASGWSFSVKTFGAQCSVDPYNTDAGDGLETDCSTPVTTNAITTAYYPLLDSTSQSCPTGNCVYREPWAQALAAAFGSGTCTVPYSPITSCHFYDMDNEVDIWSGTHRDVHPVATGYDELANLYESEAGALKTWDPAAVRFGPVSCCWWYYWNVGPSGDDKAAHGGVDFLPWWLNQIYWFDQINGARTLDVFDIHAYPDANTSGLTTAQLQALAVDIYRDYWDPAYVSTGGSINQNWATFIQPNKTIPFRIPRVKAIVNAIYPGTPLSFTEWSAAFYQESDFSTALGDADAYGIFGREGISFAARWGAPTSGNPNYQALNSAATPRSTPPARR
ncbi:MAG: glycoside hydrolase family 44 protein [Terracidiphilus sp.]